MNVLGKRLAAVAERGDHPKIHIFDLKSFQKNVTLVNSSASLSKVIELYLCRVLTEQLIE